MKTGDCGVLMYFCFSSFENVRPPKPTIAAWLDGHGPLLTYAPPDAGAIVYVRYHAPVNSTALVTRLRMEKSVLIVPGDHFGMDGYLRIGFGETPGYLRDGLARIGNLV